MANEKKKTSIGGQALIEGIMMRGPFLTSMATRLPDGSIDVETWNTHKGGQKAHWTRRVPFLRGIFNMVDSMVVGYGCLMKSAEKAGVEEEPTKFDKWLEEKLGDNLIILPSSVHETIVYSEECGPDIRRAKDMVQAVNQTELREEDFLSGEIYRYDKDSHTLSKVQVPEHEEIFMPDKVSMEEMHAYGYVWDGMLPLTKERALELMDTDLLLFKLYEDGAEGMIETKEEILSHDGLFGVERDSWMNYLNAQSQNETNGMTLEM